MNDVSAIGRIVRQYKCGVLVNEPMDTRAGLDEIRMQYVTYSRCALAAFSAELDCGRALTNVVERIGALVPAKHSRMRT